jgi:hypothetical protein
MSLSTTWAPRTVVLPGDLPRAEPHQSGSMPRQDADGALEAGLSSNAIPRLRRRPYRHCFLPRPWIPLPGRARPRGAGRKPALASLPHPRPLLRCPSRQRRTTAQRSGPAPGAGQEQDNPAGASDQDAGGQRDGYALQPDRDAGQGGQLDAAQARHAGAQQIEEGRDGRRHGFSGECWARLAIQRGQRETGSQPRQGQRVRHDPVDAVDGPGDDRHVGCRDGLQRTPCAQVGVSPASSGRCLGVSPDGSSCTSLGCASAGAPAA